VAKVFVCAIAGVLDAGNASAASSTQRGIQNAGIVSSRRTVDRMQVAGGQTATDERGDLPRSSSTTRRPPVARA
jgi:hypothetical protein